MSVSIKEMYQNPEKYCDTLDPKLLSAFLQKCINKYEDGEPLINDTLYDTVFEILKKKIHLMVKLGLLQKMKK